MQAAGVCSLYMNVKTRRTRLIVEFKEFQRLPDWTVIKSIRPGPCSENAGEAASKGAATEATRWNIQASGFLRPTP
jgi:hypothetical protein